MRMNNDDKKADRRDNEDEEGGEGGQTDQIHFRFQDAASLPPRDDALPPSEIKRLLIVHKDKHKEAVNKQKHTRKERVAIKEGKRHLIAGMRQALGIRQGGISRFKKHPISDRAQFSGIDRQVNAIPSEYDADTNPEMQEKLENRLTNRLTQTPQYSPPKLRPRGT